MLEQFTWQQFLVAAFVLSLVWYLAIFLLYYRDKAKVIFTPKTKEKSPEKLRKEWAHELEDEPELKEAENGGLMGRPVEPEGMETVAMDGIRFAEKPHNKEQQLGLVPDVLEELKGVFRDLENKDGGKSDFFPLIHRIKEKYPKIAASDNLEDINRNIRDNAPFLLTDEELEDLWD
ncbi:hypothetical protein ACVW0P_003888 [Mucilaginibacter sp. UYNi724]